MTHTKTFRVTRISKGATPLRVTFTAIGRALEWQPADDAIDPGTPQDVPEAVAVAIAADPSLAPHFLIEPNDRAAVRTATKPEKSVGA